MALRIRLIKAAVAATVLAFTVTLTGCSSDTLTEKTVEKATGDKVDIDSKDGEFSVKTEDGEFSTSQKLPEGFPKDIPLIDGTIRQATSAKEGKKLGYSVMITPKANASAVPAEVRSKMTAAGFKPSSEQSVSAYQMLMFERAPWSVAVQIINGDEVMVHYIVAPQN